MDQLASHAIGQRGLISLAGPGFGDVAGFDARFAEYLRAQALLDKQVVDRASRAAAAAGERIDRVLVQLGLLSEVEVTTALASHLGLTVIAGPELPISPILPDAIHSDFVRRSKVLPIAATPDELVVAAIDPFVEDTFRALSYLTDLNIVVRLLSATQFDKAYQTLYGGQNEQVAAGDLAHTADIHDFDVQRLRDLASEAPTIKLVSQIIADAIDSRASDIHIEPSLDTLLVRYRIDGALQNTKALNPTLRAAVTSRIKIMSRLDIAERRLPQDGRTKIAHRGIDIDFRVSTIPTAFGESVVMRILDRSRVALDFRTLGFSQARIDCLEQLIRQPDGIVLVTGPTGSGKTTTLYTALKELNGPERKIFTVEDPVEYQLTGINQVHVHAAIGLSFPAALRSILRQDPDIIMIGEVRDLETARIAVQSSLTGHLVLSTLHTNSAAASITRLLDMGIENYLLTSTLKGIVAQRLVRKLCHCSTPHENNDYWLSEFSKLAIHFDGTPNIRQRHGCKACNATGFSGRSTISEILVVDGEIHSAILALAPDIEIEALARKRGMQTMYECGVAKVLCGETTIDEVLRATRSH